MPCLALPYIIGYPDILPKDSLPKDILPKYILPNGHFADGRFAERTFCRTDILPNGQLAENRDTISSKSLGLCLISQLCNSQPLCKITII
jgi:hypothetical protein